MGTRPADLAFRYAWREGSMPPPHHYEYTIAVAADGSGTIVFCPDYPEEGVSSWEESFRVTASQLDELHRLMDEAGVFTRQWGSVEDAPVGGSLEWLEAVADGQTRLVPSTPRDPEPLQPVYALIRRLVPADLWADLERRHQAYQTGYGHPEQGASC